MTLTDSQIKSVTTEKKSLLADGGGLYLEVRRTQKGQCGKYLFGRTRFLATAKGSKVNVHIGTYGKSASHTQLTLKPLSNPFNVVECSDHQCRVYWCA